MSVPRYGELMSRWTGRSFALAVCVGLLAGVLAGCTSNSGPSPQPSSFALTPVLVSTEIVVGRNRMLFNVLASSDNRSVASPDRPLELRFFDLAANQSQAVIETSATYTPTIEGRPGLYRAIVNLDRAGEWGVEAIATEADGSKRSGRMAFSVRESGTTPALGAAAIASNTPTASTPAAIAAISTDTAPDPDFYRQSVAGALAAHEPFALIFATPAFCTSATCGPTLDVVKTAANPFKGRMDFIHVEPYELESVDGHLRPVLSPDNLPISVAATTEWGLPTEPYIFVVDTNGKVTAKFEGIASADELSAAFGQVAAN